MGLTRRSAAAPGRLSWAPALVSWALLCGALLALPVAAATRVLQPGQSLQQALQEAADGDQIDIMAGDHHGQVGVIVQKQLTLRGVGGRPVLHADGQSAEGKAILVVRSGDVRIENIEFRGARVADRNGAGIRFEKGRLLVRRCAFVDNENGILTANFGDAELTVQDSDFSRAPANTPLPHLLYVGRIQRLTVLGSRFSGGRGGHLLKTRARENRVLYNQLVDGAGGQASYELEFPNGGLAWVIGNVIGQSRSTTHPVLVSFGAEVSAADSGREHGLFMAHNTLINEGLRPGWFVRMHRLAQPVTRRFVNNLSIGLGAGELALADARQGNYSALPLVLQDAEVGLYALGLGSWLRYRGVAPGVAHGVSLAPAAEFTPPAGAQPLTAPARWSPGAYQ